MRNFLFLILSFFLLSSTLGITGCGGSSDAKQSKTSDKEKKDKNKDDEEDDDSNVPADILTLTPATQTLTISKAGYAYNLNNLTGASRLMAGARLNDGRIIFTGGRFNSALVGAIFRNSSSFYTLEVAGSGGFGSLVSGPNMNHQRYGHAMVTLPTGDVLVLGGFDAMGAVAQAEIYEEGINTFTLINEMGCTSSLTGTVRGILLTSGLSAGKVLVISDSSTTVELFDPTAGVDGCFSTTDSLGSARTGFTMTLLNNGKVLVAGGSVNTAELYDPASDTFAPSANTLSTARNTHAAALLSNGQVLIAGGFNNAFTRLNSAELYDPVLDTFTLTADTMTKERNGLSMVALTSGPQSGKVLVIGGFSNASTTFGEKLVELYDPLLDEFLDLSFEFNSQGVANHATVARADGSGAVISGGWDTGSFLTTLYDSEIGTVLSLFASGGEGDYTFSRTPAFGTIDDTKYVVPPSSQEVTLRAEDADGNFGTSILTFDASDF